MCILDEGIADGLPWMAMELVVGETLRSHIARTHGSSVPHAAQRPAAVTTGAPSTATASAALSTLPMEASPP